MMYLYIDAYSYYFNEYFNEYYLKFSDKGFFEEKFYDYHSKYMIIDVININDKTLKEALDYLSLYTSYKFSMDLFVIIKNEQRKLKIKEILE